MAIDFSEHTFKWSAILSVTPEFVRRSVQHINAGNYHSPACSIIAPFINEAKNDTRRAVPLLRPIIEERMKAQADLGEGWHDKPVGSGHRMSWCQAWLTDKPQNDILQFVLDKAIPKEESMFLIVHRLLIVNHAASGNSVNVRLASASTLFIPRTEPAKHTTGYHLRALSSRGEP